MEIFSGFSNLPKISLPVGGRDDDVFSDRLNYKYTSFILIISSFIITYKILQYDHIQCWVPAVLAMYERYINLYCWISNTYFVAFTEQTTSVNNKPERMIKYYQWVPLILLVLSLGFVLPRLFYRFLSKQSGVDMYNMADAAVSYITIDKYDQKRKILTYLTNTIHCYTSCNRTKRALKNNTAGNGKIISHLNTKSSIYNLLNCRGMLDGIYLTLVYIFIKLSYMLNCMAQLMLLNLFLGFSYNLDGITFLRDALSRLFTYNKIANKNIYSQQSHLAVDNFESQKNIFTESVYPVGFDGKVPSDSSVSSTLLHRYFPRQSACDIRIRMNVDSMVQNFTVQCVLPINLFNEQIFTLIWAWLWIVFLINIYEFIAWLVRLLPSKRDEYIRHRLHLTDENSVKKSIDSFINDYLSFDGVFLLRILTLNSSDVVTHDVVETLWYNYNENLKKHGLPNIYNQSDQIKDDELNIDIRRRDKIQYI